MAARKLSETGKKVIVIEARNRIGGRIFSLPKNEFGFLVEAGAEFVHGDAPITKQLIKEIGLTYIPEEGEIWSARSGELRKEPFSQTSDELTKKLKELKVDISISDFLDQNFGGKENEGLRNSIIKVVEGYDAADPKLISTFAVRDEWLGTNEWKDGKIKEGYGPMLDYLEQECKNAGVEFILNTKVKSVEHHEGYVAVTALTEEKEVKFEADKIIITVPLPIYKEIEFNPPITEKLELASKIGFGSVIKIAIKFKNRWWLNARGVNLENLAFLLCDEKFMTWWTQYPEKNPLLVAWMAGPDATKYKDASDDELLDMAILSLSNVFKIDKKNIVDGIVMSKVYNWPADPFTRGAYSYYKVETMGAPEKLAEPINNTVFFAGEALYSGDAVATVEGAFGSGMEVVEKIKVE